MRLTLLTTVLLLLVCSPADAQLIGVDFDEADNSFAASPVNWNSLYAEDTFPARTSTPMEIDNLINEAGNTTDVDFLLSTNNGFTRGFASPINNSRAPQHSNSLLTVGGGYFFNNNSQNDSLSALFFNLVPDAEYDVWAFSTKSTFWRQDITITGGGDPVSFSAFGQSSDLWVNGEESVSTRDLDSYAVRVRASSSGSIDVSWTESRFLSGSTYSAAGVAIRPAVPEPGSGAFLVFAILTGFCVVRNRVA